MEMERRGGDEERRPDVALCPLTWSHVRLERKRRRTGSGKRDVEPHKENRFSLWGRNSVII